MTTLDVAIAAAALLGAIVAWFVAGPGPLNLIISLLAFGGAALAAMLVPRNPVAAIGVVILLAPLGRLTLALPVGQMRIEQPAIAALLLAAVIHRRRLPALNWRPLVPAVAAAGAYLLVLAISSALVAPQPIASLRIVGWTLLSMVAGLLMVWLTAHRPAQVLGWFTAAGVFTAVLGLALAAVYYFVGFDAASVGIGSYGPPKVVALSHEPNLYAIFLAAMAPFAAERFRRRPTYRTATALALILVAIGMGITRSAYIGLFLALPIYLFLLVRRRVDRQQVLRLGAFVLVATVVGMVVAPILLDPARRAIQPVANRQPSRSPAPAPVSSSPPVAPGDLDLNLSTLEFRLKRIGPAVDDFLTSPLIGLGAYSYGQRHPLLEGYEDVISIMALLVLYDSGVLGALALAAFFVLLLVRLWRTTRDPPRAGLAAAYIASIVILLVAYQATTALHFTFTWLVIGGALGITAVRGRAAEDGSTEAVVAAA